MSVLVTAGAGAPSPIQDATTRAHFEIDVTTNWGDSVVIAGSASALGEWDPHRGLHMATDEHSYPTWKASCSLSEWADLEYKVVVLRAGGGPPEWESRANRRLVLRGVAEVRVASQWDASSATETCQRRPSASSPTAIAAAAAATPLPPTIMSLPVAVPPSASGSVLGRVAASAAAQSPEPLSPPGFDESIAPRVNPLGVRVGDPLLPSKPRHRLSNRAAARPRLGPSPRHAARPRRAARAPAVTRTPPRAQ